MSPYRYEVQRRHVFHLALPGAAPERWASQEDHDGEAPPTRFECFWIPLEAHTFSSPVRVRYSAGCPSSRAHAARKVVDRDEHESAEALRLPACGQLPRPRHQRARRSAGRDLTRGQCSSVHAPTHVGEIDDFGISCARERRPPRGTIRLPCAPPQRLRGRNRADGGQNQRRGCVRLAVGEREDPGEDPTSSQHNVAVTDEYRRRHTFRFFYLAEQVGADVDAAPELGEGQATQVTPVA
jgi:hypothetical protein